MLEQPIQVCRPSVTWWKVGAGEQKSLGVEHEAVSAVEDSARAGKLGLSGNSDRCRICHPKA